MLNFNEIRKIVLTSSLKYKKGSEFDFSYIFLFLWEKEEGVWFGFVLVGTKKIDPEWVRWYWGVVSCGECALALGLNSLNEGKYWIESELDLGNG